jgi:methyltransferase family protein
MISRIAARLVRDAYRRLPIVGNDGFDIGEIIKLKAAMDTADYCMEHLPCARVFPSALALLSYALTRVSVAGLFLEFGVASGLTINHIACHTTSKVHGFDSFEGLPEDWHTGFQKGQFAQKPPVVRKNVALHTGLFRDTLAGFVRDNQQPVAFMHVDCDLYSSTKEVLTCLGGLIVPGTVIVFDEYFNHPTWRQDEWRAFQEFVRDRILSYKYIGYVPSHQQAAVIIE